MFKLPRCRHCKRPWKPAEGVVASQSYCSACRPQRLKKAQRILSLRPIAPDEFDGPYILPKRAKSA